MGKVQAPDPEKAIEFFSNTFVWKFEKMHGSHDYWFIITGESDKPGIDGGFMKSPDGATRTINSSKFLPSMNIWTKSLKMAET
jgi:uncharacterized protein